MVRESNDSDSQPKILIVEDDDISQFVLQKMLGNHYQVILTRNSEEAFQVLNQQDFTIILMDINLGEDSMSGTEIMRHIKTTGKYGDPPIFALTSYAMPEDKETFLQEGFDDYLAKPVKKEELLGAIEKSLA